MGADVTRLLRGPTRRGCSMSACRCISQRLHSRDALYCCAAMLKRTRKAVFRGSRNRRLATRGSQSLQMRWAPVWVQSPQGCQSVTAENISKRLKIRDWKGGRVA